MKRFLIPFFVILIATATVSGQKSRSTRKPVKPSKVNSVAQVIDERLSVLRTEPSLYAAPVKRLMMGTDLNVFEEKEGDGVTFYKVADSTALTGWIQSEAIAGTFRKDDDFRLVRLIQGSNGFTLVHRASIFLDLFPKSDLRPSVLLLLGDSVETQADEISKRASEALVRREMAAAKAPVHSFYLNYSELDPYRMLGIRFLFNEKTKTLHYNGDAWFDITTNYPESEQSIEARVRIKILTELVKQ